MKGEVMGEYDSKKPNILTPPFPKEIPQPSSLALVPLSGPSAPHFLEEDTPTCKCYPHGPFPIDKLVWALKKCLRIREAELLRQLLNEREIKGRK
jgi:hypothetical protein